MKIISGNWKKINLCLFRRKIFLVWNGWFNIIFMVLVFVSVILALYILYVSTYKSAWSEERKQQYLNENSNEVLLNVEEFDYVKKKLESRAVVEKEPVEEIRDIFN